MAGVLQIHEMTGAAAGADKTSDTVRFKSADETTVDDTNRIQIPAAGTERSYTKTLRGYVDSAPDTDFSNLEAYTDGGSYSDTWVTVQYDVNQNWAANVTTDISGTDLFTMTSGNAIDMDSWDTAWTAGEGTGYWGSFLRLQMEVGTGASPGTLNAETLTVSYDET
jgi:hypothetical protein